MRVAGVEGGGGGRRRTRGGQDIRPHTSPHSRSWNGFQSVIRLPFTVVKGKEGADGREEKMQTALGTGWVLWNAFPPDDCAPRTRRACCSATSVYWARRPITCTSMLLCPSSTSLTLCTVDGARNISHLIRVWGNLHLRCTIMPADCVALKGDCAGNIRVSHHQFTYLYKCTAEKSKL